MNFKTNKLPKLSILPEKANGLQGLITPNDDVRNAIIRRWESSGLLDGITGATTDSIGTWQTSSQNDLYQYEFTIGEGLNNSDLFQQILRDASIVSGVANDIRDTGGYLIGRTYSYHITMRQAESTRLDDCLRWNNIEHYVTRINIHS